MITRSTHQPERRLGCDLPDPPPDTGARSVTLRQDRETAQRLTDLIAAVAAKEARGIVDVPLRRRLAHEQEQAIRIARQRRHETPVPGARRGYFQTPLRDGTTGYFMRRADDCLQIAIATLAQIPPHKVPDSQIDRQVLDGRDPEEIMRGVDQAFIRWSDKLGMTIVIHAKPPVTERRWIGVVPVEGQFNDHCLVMERGERLHDPISLWSSDGADDSGYGVGDIDFGITIRRE
jgi:hypothetical protein